VTPKEEHVHEVYNWWEQLFG